MFLDTVAYSLECLCCQWGIGGWYRGMGFVKPGVGTQFYLPSVVIEEINILGGGGGAQEASFSRHILEFAIMCAWNACGDAAAEDSDVREVGFVACKCVERCCVDAAMVYAVAKIDGVYESIGPVLGTEICGVEKTANGIGKGPVGACS